MPYAVNAEGQQQAFDYERWAAQQLERIETALDQHVSASAPAELGQAMRYAALNGGKRLRPLLVLATAQAVGVQETPAALRAACAVELIHAYSLVHDDLPCMDNDVLRRGQPTVHVKFGEALALLAGDALQALAFEVLTPADETQVALVAQARLVAVLARAAGAMGMAGGQAIDLTHVGLSMDEQHLQEMHQLKTGALLSGCISLGMACSTQSVSRQARDALNTYGHALGLAFQVVDDILDATAESAVIGKTAGKDAQAGKPTYVSLLGLAAARQRAQALYTQARQALLHSGLTQIAPLQALADKMVARSY